MKKTLQDAWRWWLPAVTVLLGLSLLIADPPLQQAVRLQLFDQYQRWLPRAAGDAPVRVIDIDEASLARHGQWPWPRTVVAQLVERLTVAGAAAIAFDVMFVEPDRTAPRALADVWQLEGRLRTAVTALPDHDAVLAARVQGADVVLGFAVERTVASPPPAVNPAVPPALPTVPPASPRLPVSKARFIHAGTPAPHWINGFDAAITGLPLLEQAAAGSGALTFVPDRDGVVRRVPLVLRVGTTLVPSLAGEALRVGQGTTNVMLNWADGGAGLESIRIGEVVVPVTPRGEFWVHYARPDTRRSLPAWRVLDGSADPRLLAGQIVLVGSSAQGLMDLRFSPSGLIPGVEAHTQAIEQILLGTHLQRPSWARGLEALLVLVAGLIAGLAAVRWQALRAALLTCALLAALLGSGWAAFAQAGLLLDSLTPALTVVLSFLVCSLAHHFVSEREQRWIHDAFARYVSPNRVAYLMTHPEAMALGGQRAECSFIFTDLAGFTSLMEKIDPAAAVALLNDYLDAMIAIAFRHEGTLDRIVGDAVAIMFSAPVPQADHRRRAYACALEMDAYADRYSRDLQARGISFGRTRIGVHCGPVIVGNFGGKNIFDYRALGDPINTAARLEAVNKHLGTRLCVSAAILADCPSAEVRPVGRLVLKGKTEPLAVFEPWVAAVAPTYAPPAEYAVAHAAMAAEQAEAAERFAELAGRYPDDPLVRLHHARLRAGERGDLIVMNEK